jgi:hypothetical protein
MDEPQCVQVCPVACIPVDPKNIETRDQLWAKYRLLVAPADPAEPPTSSA